MIMITGAVSSGTSLVSLFLHHNGIDMGVEYDDTAFQLGSALHDIYEDPEFSGLIPQYDGSINVKHLVKLIKSRGFGYWGFKLPRAVCHWNVILRSLVSISDEVTVVHVFRDMSETYESWIRKKKHHDMEIHGFEINAILYHHHCALKAYSAYSSKCKFLFLDIRDLLTYPEEFHRELDIPFPYQPVEDILKTVCLRPAESKHTHERADKIYGIMEKLKWQP